MAKGCVWRRRQKWKEEDHDHEVDLPDGHALQGGEAILGLEIDLPQEMLEKHHQLQTDLGLQQVGPPDLQEDPEIPDPLEELPGIQDPLEELIPGPQNDPETHDHLEGPQVQMLKDLVLNKVHRKQKIQLKLFDATFYFTHNLISTNLLLKILKFDYLRKNIYK